MLKLKKKSDSDDAIKIDIIMYFLIGFSLVFFSYNLTYSSLWYDEAVEYWYSNSFIGNLPFYGEGMVGDGSNMYLRIISTFQPPLYNFIIHFWLKIADTEWWFRFFGVICGTVCIAFIYKTIKEIIIHISDNYKEAKVCAFISGVLLIFNYKFVYYVQECAEYNLMLCMLVCAIYYFIKLTYKYEFKNFLFMVLFCILSVLSQYGAIFPVFSMLIVFLFVSIKNRIDTRRVLITYIISFIFVVIPLYLLFLKIQSDKIGSSYIGIGFGIQFMKDFFENINILFQFIFYPSIATDNTIIINALFIMIIIGFIITILKNRIPKIVMIFSLITWVAFFIAVESGKYARGNFSLRYSLCLMPIIIIDIVIITYNAFYILKKSKYLISNNMAYLFVFVVIGLIIGNSYIHWNAIDNPIKKGDMRELCEEWYANNGFLEETVVYFGAGPEFSYYIYHNDDFNEAHFNNVSFMKYEISSSKQYYIDEFCVMYNNDLPNKFLYVTSHLGNGDYNNAIISGYEELGYSGDIIYNGVDAMLIEYTK